MISIAVGITAAFCFLLFGPQRGESSVLLTSTQAMREQLARGAAVTTRLSEIEAEVQQVKDRLVNYRATIPVTADLGAFIEELSVISERLELRAWKVVLLAPKTRGPVRVLPVQIAFESSFGESFSFLRAIERLARAVRVTELNIERLREPSGDALGGEGNDLQTMLTMQVFHEAT
jgi:Tfp pilus assembly protein PilO